MAPAHGGARVLGGQVGLTGNLVQLSSAVAKMFEMQTSIAKMCFVLLFLFVDSPGKQWSKS